MAKNWSTAEAARTINEGKDLAAIQDIGRRFPLFAVMAASGVEGLLTLLDATPEHLTTRKIESKLKEGLDESTLEDDVEEAEEEVEVAKDAKKGKKGKGKKAAEVEDDEEEAPKKGKKGKGKKKPDPEPEVEEDDEDEEDEDGDGYEDMSLVELKKAAKKNKVDIKGLKKPKEIIKALRADAEDEDEDEDDEDEDWDI